MVAVPDCKLVLTGLLLGGNWKMAVIGNHGPNIDRTIPKLATVPVVIKSGKMSTFLARAINGSSENIRKGLPSTIRLSLEKLLVQVFVRCEKPIAERWGTKVTDDCKIRIQLTPGTHVCGGAEPLDQP